MEYEIGDRVKINKQATIEDFTKHCWNGCQIDTLKFIQNYGDKDKTFRVVRLDNGCLDLKEIGSDCVNELVNINILKKISVKEMTISEIEKKLGYPIKIINED